MKSFFTLALAILCASTKGISQSGTEPTFIKLPSFIATLNNNKVDLEWITASETNVSHYVIEKSTDGKSFSAAGLVFAFGNTTSDAGYSFSDKLKFSAPGLIYYRLRIVDTGGTSEFSPVRIIRIAGETDSAVSIITYPNPVSNEVRITIPADWQNKKVLYEIFNAAGKTVNKIEASNSGQTQTINVSNLSRGFYIVKASADGETSEQKIIKQ